MFNLNIEYTGKTRTIIKIIGRALVKKKVVMLGSTETDTINNADICDTYIDLHLAKKDMKRSCFKVYSQRMV